MNGLSIQVPRRLGVALGFAVMLPLAACSSYEPPQPGKHFAPGEKRTDLKCEFGAQTATRLPSWRCDRTADADAKEDRAREVLDRPMIQPRMP
jgi:hypothetical protein